MSRKSQVGKRNSAANKAESIQSPSGPPFKIRMGLPHMDNLWKDLNTRFDQKTLNARELRLYSKWGKALRLLSANPFYPGLNSHEINSLTQKYGKKIFESYLENRTPGAARMFWAYGPGRAEITILALEPHPEADAYGRVKLDSEP
jgi:hypothetical protein